MQLNRRPELVLPVLTVLLLFITALDYMTGPQLNLSITYFIPITIAAWLVGRYAALFFAAIAIFPYIHDQLVFVEITGRSLEIACANVVVRLLIYVFAGEAVYRLTVSEDKARRAANLLERANQELKLTYARIDEDLDAAGHLQAASLSALPVSQACCQVGVHIEYAGRTGGDLADAGELDHGIYACIADISGKGTTAALYTALLKYLLWEGIQSELRCGELIDFLNRSLEHSLPNDRFVTLFYLELNPNNGELFYVNAGHPEGVLLRSLSSEIELVGPTSSALGIYLPLSINVGKLQLNAGDVLTLYTDGATDAVNFDGKRLGDDYIQELVAVYAHLDAQEMADRIVKEIMLHTEAKTRDDITVMCIKHSS